MLQTFSYNGFAHTPAEPFIKKHKKIDRGTMQNKDININNARVIISESFF